MRAAYRRVELRLRGCRIIHRRGPASAQSSVRMRCARRCRPGMRLASGRTISAPDRIRISFLKIKSRLELISDRSRSQSGLGELRASVWVGPESEAEGERGTRRRTKTKGL